MFGFSKMKSAILNSKGEAFELLDYGENAIKESARKTFTDMDAVSVSQVLSSFNNTIRSRSEIYSVYSKMLDDPIIGQALNLHVTQTLGGHETTGDVIFIEAKPNISSNEAQMVAQIREDLNEKINKTAYQMAFLGCGYGDSYARLYGKEKEGISFIDVSEFYLPPFVQPFELLGKTVGFRVQTDKKIETLSPRQLSRLKMPRMGVVPQYRMQYNYFVESVVQDDLNAHQPVPSNIGGSFCELAEKPFLLLQSALIGLSSGRILDSVRESIIGVNMANMTQEQQTNFIEQFGSLLRQAKKRTMDAVRKNEPVLEKVIHLLPVWDEKQLYSVDAGGALNTNNSNAYNIEDVLFYAKLLAGSLGLDLSMLGFSDLLSGGLGDGGFFRVSAQSGQRSRLIRQAVTDWTNHVIDVHCSLKFGGIFNEGKRPYEIVFNGATSALERENQETRERKNMAAATVLQNIAALKELGANEATIAHFLKEQMAFDEDDAKLYASALSGNDENVADEEIEE